MSLYFLSACAGKPANILIKESPMIEDRSLVEKKLINKLTEDLNLLPDWYLSPPTMDGYIFVAASSTSSDIQMAIEKAVLLAKYSLASQRRNQISSGSTLQVNENNSSNKDNFYTNITKDIQEKVININLLGHTHVKTEVKNIGQNYRAFVLLRYPSPDTALMKKRSNLP